MQEIERLYRAHSQTVYRYLLGLTRDPVLAEDLLSETFLEALRSAGSYRGDAPVGAWLCGIARHRFLRHIRKNKTALEYDDRLALVVSDELERGIIAKEAVARVKELLSERDERSRRVLELRLELYSYAEIGAELGISENSARVVEFRTRKWLRETLEKEGLL